MNLRKRRQMFKRLCKYLRWYFGRKEAIRAVLAEERRKTEKIKKRLEEQHQEREVLHAMLQARVEGLKKTG